LVVLTIYLSTKTRDSDMPLDQKLAQGACTYLILTTILQIRRLRDVIAMMDTHTTSNAYYTMGPIHGTPVTKYALLVMQIASLS